MPITADPLELQIRTCLDKHAKLGHDAFALASEADLFQAGLTSHASVNLMLALEDRFEVEFPERMLRRGAFSSIRAIRSAIEELTRTAP